MSIITIAPKSGKEELVILPRSEFEKLQKKSLLGPTLRGYEAVKFAGKQYKVPIYQLIGRAAIRLDARVKRALQEYKSGEARQIQSLADLD